MVSNINSVTSQAHGVAAVICPNHQVHLAVHGAAKKRSVKHLKKSKVTVRPKAPQKSHGNHKAKKGHVKQIKKAPAKHKMKKGHVKHVKTSKVKQVPHPKAAKHGKAKPKKHKITKVSHSKSHKHAKTHHKPAKPVKKPAPVVPTPPPAIVYPTERVGFSMVGLENAGGSCYLNSIIQTLKHMPRFCEYVAVHCPAVPPTQVQFEGACAASQTRPATAAEQQVIQDWLVGCLRALFLQMDALPPGSALPPQFSGNIRHFFVLAGFGRPGPGGTAPNPETAQMDGGEFMQDLLRLINFPMIRVRKHTEYRVAGSTEVAQITEDNDSMTLDIAINSNQSLNQHITGLNSVIPMSYLAPSIVKPASFNGKTQCDQTVASSLVCDPLHPPTMLPIRLGRFTFTAPIQKISDRLDVPQRITVPIAGSATTATYELSSVAVHCGSPNGGHYVACVPAGAGRWYTFDDGNVVPHPDRTAVTSLVDNSGYVLCYELVS